jgi:photosystem II stability/assembly factor-like uncharacterized protein
VNEIRELRRLDPVASVNVEGVSAHPTFEELFDRIVAEPVDGPSAFADSTDPLGDESGSVVPGEHPEEMRRRTRLLITSVAAAVLLAVGLSAAFVGGGSISGPVTTPWRAAHALPSAERVTSPRGPSGSWQLVGDIVRTGWQLNTAGPAPGLLDCPTASACYVTGDGTVSDSGPADYDSLYVSNDGGLSWAVLALPAGFNFTAPLSCSGAVVCAGGGVLNGQAVFITTVDGGHQWTVAPLSISGELVKLVCVSASTCNGVAAPASVATSMAEGEPVSQQQTDADETFVRSTDGGRTWTTYSLGPGDFVISLACPTAISCRAIGYSLSARQTSGDFSGFVLSTNDGGTSWHDGVLPPSFGFGPLSTLSCADTAHCMASGLVIEPNPYECGVASEPIGASGSACSSGATEEVTGIVTTTDGGTTWQLQSLPSDVPLPQLFAVSCSGASTCWVAGEEAVPQGNDGGSAVVLGTTDGGTTWAKITFTVPPAPNDVGGDAYMAVGSISCPSTLGCLALGVSDQGSKTTPVYSDVVSDSQ